MELAKLLTKNLIKLTLEGEDKDEVFEEMVEIINRSDKIKDRELVLEGLIDREEKGSTGVGNGIAIPHIRSEAMKDTAVALGLSNEGLDYDALDSKPVHIIFMVLATKTISPTDYLSILREISQLMNVPGFQSKLLNASDPQEIIDIIANIEEF